jgi:hypothetical protein
MRSFVISVSESPAPTFGRARSSTPKISCPVPPSRGYGSFLLVRPFLPFWHYRIGILPFRPTHPVSLRELQAPIGNSGIPMGREPPPVGSNLLFPGHFEACGHFAIWHTACTNLTVTGHSRRPRETDGTSAVRQAPSGRKGRKAQWLVR